MMYSSVLKAFPEILAQCLLRHQSEVFLRCTHLHLSEMQQIVWIGQVSDCSCK